MKDSCLKIKIETERVREKSYYCPSSCNLEKILNGLSNLWRSGIYFDLEKISNRLSNLYQYEIYLEFESRQKASTDIGKTTIKSIMFFGLPTAYLSGRTVFIYLTLLKSTFLPYLFFENIVV